MQNVVTIGNKLLPIEQIAYVEAFDAAANTGFETERQFKARLVLLNRDTVLTEESTPREFAEAHGFRFLSEDNVATNPAVTFRVESFEPTDSFKPTKPYLTRLKWRDPELNDRSKLLLTNPETVIAVALRGESEPGSDRKRPRRPARRRTSRQREPRAEA
jgi:hypothetical protein